MSDPIHVGRLDPAEWLGRSVRVVIDRSLRSLHPSGTFRYEHNYGFIPGFIAADGEELDAYVLGPTEPLDEYVGTVIAVVLRDDDIDDKLVVGDARDWTADIVTESIRFQEQFFGSTVSPGLEHPGSHRTRHEDACLAGPRAGTAVLHRPRTTRMTACTSPAKEALELVGEVLGEDGFARAAELLDGPPPMAPERCQLGGRPSGEGRFERRRADEEEPLLLVVLRSFELPGEHPREDDGPRLLYHQARFLEHLTDGGVLRRLPRFHGAADGEPPRWSVGLGAVDSAEEKNVPAIVDEQHLGAVSSNAHRPSFSPTTRRSGDVRSGCKPLQDWPP